MWRLWASLCCLLALGDARSRPSFHPLSDELVNYVNKQNTTWQVGCGAASYVCPLPGRSVHTDSRDGELTLTVARRTLCPGPLRNSPDPESQRLWTTPASSVPYPVFVHECVCMCMNVWLCARGGAWGSR